MFVLTLIDPRTGHGQEIEGEGSTPTFNSLGTGSAPL